jgi:hypothetical protein
MMGVLACPVRGGQRAVIMARASSSSPRAKIESTQPRSPDRDRSARPLRAVLPVRARPATIRRRSWGSQYRERGISMRTLRRSRTYWRQRHIEAHLRRVAGPDGSRVRFPLVF